MLFSQVPFGTSTVAYFLLQVCVEGYEIGGPLPDLSHQVGLTFTQHSLNLLAIGNIDDPTQNQRRTCILKWRQTDFGREFSAILAPGKKNAPDTNRPRNRVIIKVLAQLRMTSSKALGNEDFYRGLNQIITAVSEQGFKFGVHVNYFTGLIYQCNRCR